MLSFIFPAYGMAAIDPDPEMPLERMIGVHYEGFLAEAEFYEALRPGWSRYDLPFTPDNFVNLFGLVVSPDTKLPMLDAEGNYQYEEGRPRIETKRVAYADENGQAREVVLVHKRTVDGRPELPIAIRIDDEGRLDASLVPEEALLVLRQREKKTARELIRTIHTESKDALIELLDGKGIAEDREYILQNLARRLEEKPEEDASSYVLILARRRGYHIGARERRDERLQAIIRGTIERVRPRSATFEGTASPDILIGVPLSENIAEQREKITEAAIRAQRTIPESVGIVFYADTGDERFNLARLQTKAARLGVGLVVPISRTVRGEDLVTVIENGLLIQFSKERHELAHPRVENVESLRETREKLASLSPVTWEAMPPREQAEMRQRVAERLNACGVSPIYSELTSVLSIHNLRMTEVSNQTGLGSLSPRAQAYVENPENIPRASLIRVDSEAEVKFQAEAHRRRNPKNNKLKIILALDDADVVAKWKDAKTRKAMLETMGIEEALLSADDVIVMSEQEANMLSPSEIYNRYLAEYQVSEVGIADTRRERNLSPEDIRLLKEAVFVEYVDVATAWVYDVILEIRAHRFADTGIPGVERHAEGLRQGVLWFVLPPAKGIDMNELRKEIELYRKVLTAL